MSNPHHRIAVICACPPHYNPGMHTVDLALDLLLARHHINVEVRRYTLYLPQELHAAKLGGSLDNYGHLDEIYTSDAIIFWGDFLHSRLALSLKTLFTIDKL